MARAKKIEVQPSQATDLVAERLAAAGVRDNEHILDLNGSLTVPQDFEMAGVWALPCSLFRFPVSVGRFDGVNDRHMGLRHPLLSDHPFVRHIEAALGTKLQFEGKAETWTVARDLMTMKHWKTLLTLRRFTTDLDVALAVSLRLRSDRGDFIDTRTARLVLNAIGAVEPCNPLALLCRLSKPLSLIGDDKVERWPVNDGREASAFERGWAFVAGLERGWLAHKGGHLEWTSLGRDRYKDGPDALFVETASGQTAFAF